MHPAASLISALAILALVRLRLTRTGGDMKMAKIQVQAFLVVLLVGYLCAMSFRGCVTIEFSARS